MRKTIFKSAVCLIGLSALLLSACGKKAIVRQYYMIEFPVSMDSTLMNEPPLSQGICEILPLKIAPAFAGERIALRTESHEVRYYFYHVWAVRPQEAILNQVESFLQSRRLFSVVSRRIWELAPEYQVQMNVYQLEAIEKGDQFSAHLHMDMTLLDRNRNLAAVFHSFDRIQILERKDMNLLASAVSEILEAELQKFSEKCRAYLIAAPNAPAAPEQN